MQTCEAIKLYLNVPGIIFVLACDLLILSRGFGEQRGQAVTCLEMIIQVAYRVPRPDEEQIARLIRQCSLDSGTGGLIDEAASRALAERTNRNPRRIKRIINSFILDYALDPGWAEPPLGVASLIKAVLLYQLYPGFYDVFVGDYSSEHPVADFFEYGKLANHPAEWQPLARRVLTAYHSEMQPASVEEALKQMAERLPESVPGLVQNQDLILLLESLGDAEIRQAIRARLRRSPLHSERLLTGAVLAGNQLSRASLAAGQQLNALTDQLRAQLMATEGAAADEHAQYAELRLEAEANEAAASSAAQGAQHKMRTNAKIMEGFDQVLFS